MYSDQIVHFFFPKRYLPLLFPRALLGLLPEKTGKSLSQPLFIHFNDLPISQSSCMPFSGNAFFDIPPHRKYRIRMRLPLETYHKG